MVQTKEKNEMNEEDIKSLYRQGIDCSQAVAQCFTRQTGLDKKTLRKMGACFGGGMRRGETCGAVTGALMVLGLKYGHCREGDLHGKKLLYEKMDLFEKLFLEKYPSLRCRELLGHDIGTPEGLERILEQGLLFNFCPAVAAHAIGVLEKIL